MRRFVIMLMVCTMHCLGVLAQDDVFKTKIYNKEHDLVMDINLYEEKVRIPGQEVLGLVYGYLKKTTDSRVWIVMGVEISDDGRSARIEMINDYGSEDLEASLAVGDDGVYTLKQLEGSTIKVAGRGKWIKLPKVINFKKEK